MPPDRYNANDSCLSNEIRETNLSCVLGRRGQCR